MRYTVENVRGQFVYVISIEYGIENEIYSRELIWMVTSTSTLMWCLNRLQFKSVSCVNDGYNPIAWFSILRLW